MRLLLALVLVFLTLKTFSQNLSQEEQRKLLEEVKLLREKVKALEGRSEGTVPPDLMKTLQKGLKHQQDQQRALDELEKED